MRASLIAAICGLTAFSFAQDASKHVVPGHLMGTAPTIDGTIDEAAEWKDVPKFEGLVDANTGENAPESSTFWLAYDDKYIYFAARNTDSKPDQIAATEYRTNVSLGGNDIVALLVDPFGSLNDFNIFRVNPRGATDITIAGGRAAKREWLGDIQAAGKITETGWDVEARIPWSIMRLPGQGVHDLRFNVFRVSRRLQREFSWKQMQADHIQETPHWTQVALPPGPPKTLKLLPFTYVGWDEDEGEIFNSGIDLKTSLTEQLEFVGTINPDFRNIENDILSLDFSYFERIAGESRPFFLEGGEHFHTSNDAPIFLSQRIQGFDAGAKIYGKLDDKTDIAILDTADFGKENALVFNTYRQFTPRSSARFAYSGLDVDEENIENRAVHMEIRQGWGAWDAFYQHAFTDDKQNDKGQRNNAGVVYNQGNTNGVFEYSSVTDRFDPKLGFAPQRGFEGFSGSLDTVRRFKTGPFMEDGYSLFWREWNDFDGDKYLHELFFFTSYTLRDGMDFDSGVMRTEFGGFEDTVYFLSLEKPRGDQYRRWQVDYAWGEIQNLDYKEISVSLAYRPVTELQLYLSYQHFDLGDTSEQLILSGTYDMGNDQSISGRAVMRDDEWNAYLSYRKSGNRGAEYYLILGDPNADEFRSAVIFKVTYPLELVLR